MGNIPEEVLLALAAKNSGGGSGGTSNYEDLENKPKINGETLSGNKSASDLGLATDDAVQGILDGQSIDSFSDVESALADKVDKVAGKVLSTNDYTDADKAIVGGVTAALAGKQNVLTAGDYIDIDGNEISVNPVVPNEEATYQIVSDGQEGGTYFVRINKIVDGEVVLTERYSTVDNVKRTFDDTIRIDYANTVGWNFTYELLVASTTHDAGYTYSWGYSAQVDIDEVVVTADHSGESLVLKAQMDTALSGKQNTLTFDSVPTDGSTNPVESNGVYDALALKQDKTDNTLQTTDKTVVGAVNELKSGLTNVVNVVTISQNSDIASLKEGLNAVLLSTGLVIGESPLTPIALGNNFRGYITKNGNTFVGTISNYDSTETYTISSTSLAAISYYEKLSGKQDKTDNALTTTDKTIVGAINEVKTGLTTLDNEVNGDSTVYPYADVITIPDAIPANLADCAVKIEPVQDLHGQSAPYVGGAGKNKLPLVLADIKAANTIGTWNGNVYTINQGTITVSVDDADNIIGFVVNGTFSSTAKFNIFNGTFSAGSYKITGGINNGLAFGARNNAGSMVYSTGSEVAYNLTEDKVSCDAHILIGADTFTDRVLYPMIRLATETDATFAPYTNICPITGHTEASVERDGKNLIDIPSSYIHTVASAYRVYTVTDACEVKVGERYTLSGEITNGSYQEWFLMCSDTAYNKNTELAIASGSNVVSTLQAIGFGDNYLNRFSGRTIVADKKYIYLLHLAANVAGDETFANVQLELGSSATDYEPFKGKTYTIALGDTIYGGTVDFDSGVMTVDRKIVDLGDLTWYKTNSNLFWSQSVSDFDKAYYKDGYWYADAICSHYLYAMDDRGVYDSHITLYYEEARSYYRIFVSDPTKVGLTDAQYKTAVEGYKLCYKFATPLTVQLTPTQIQLLKGTNTLTASTGQISVTVNGVSGAIGQVQTVVNDHEERIEAVESGLTNYQTQNDINLEVPDRRNLWDGNYTDITALTVTYKPIKVANGNYTISTTCPKNSLNGANIFFLSGNVQEGASTVGNGVWEGHTKTVASANGYVTIAYKLDGGVDPRNYDTQIEYGSTATAYTPYIPSVESRLSTLQNAVPDAPTTDGAYVLTVTVADGTPTYSWESAT